MVQTFTPTKISVPIEIPQPGSSQTKKKSKRFLKFEEIVVTTLKAAQAISFARSAQILVSLYQYVKNT